MKKEGKAAKNLVLAHAIQEVIERTATNLGNHDLKVHQNPGNGKIKITSQGPDCEDGMYQLRWRVP